MMRWRARMGSACSILMVAALTGGCSTNSTPSGGDVEEADTWDAFDDGLDVGDGFDVDVGSAPQDARLGDTGERETGSVNPPRPGLQVVVMTTEEAAANFGSWKRAFEPSGMVLSLDTSAAHRTPTEEDFRRLAERYDVALVTGPGAAQAYASAAWNELPIGLVTTEVELTGRQGWHWLDVGDTAPVGRHLAEVDVADPHEVLYGISVRDRGRIKIQPAARTRDVRGFLRQRHGTTDLGVVALSFQDEGTRDMAQQLVLWEPGPFFTGSAQHAAARRAVLGLETTDDNAAIILSVEGEQLLTQMLVWAARLGEPVRTEVAFDPVGLLLTWQRDPTSTMTIDWHVLPEDSGRRQVRYWPDGQTERRIATAAVKPFPFSTRLIHRVELTGLEPDTTYLFDFGEDSRLFRFRTMPREASKPLHFLVGGDVRHTMDMMVQTNKEAHRHNPAFIAWGGDLAYANGRPDLLYRWYEWFEAMKATLIAGDGRVIPVIVAIGNHEVRQGYYSQHDGFEPTDVWRREIAPYFYELFAFPGQPGYAALDFGDYMSWIILDTAHTNPIEGRQVEWLTRALTERRHVTHVFPMYHVPAYPSVRGFMEVFPRQVRENIVPVLEAHGVRTAFENHDHTYKRTRPIRAGTVSNDGIVYLGDGAWGVATREPRTPEQEWYLAKSRGVRHFIVGTIEKDRQIFRVFDENGRWFDEIER
jgi:acid phosphatase type 7